jgi:hypothetical protein
MGAIPAQLMYARIKRAAFLLALTGIAAALLAVPAQGAPMEVTKLGRHLCKAVHGGKFVDIPGFPGEKIDRRLLPDIHWMKRRFDIFITDGLSNDPIHAPNGEHPIGLATDIIPDFAHGGRWRDIAHLAHLAEPEQNAPIMPWRWVGWNGDPGHGRGNHLHLSWSHSPTEPGDPARVVYTRNCPVPHSEQTDGSGQHHRRHHPRRRDHDGSSGGVGATDGGGGSGSDSGGVGGKRAGDGIGRLAPIVPELY